MIHDTSNERVVSASERLLLTPTIKNALWISTNKAERTQDYYPTWKDIQVTQIQTLLLAIFHCYLLSMHHENTQISQPVAIAGLPGVYCLDVTIPERAMLVAPQMVQHTNPTGATQTPQVPQTNVPPTTSGNLGWKFAKHTHFSSPVQLW